ncbi:SDR family NAD(P)-dependent oxidoreductase [Streptomyces shenzhenensis]
MTDPDAVAAAARTAGDVDLLVNNAGHNNWAHLLDDDLDGVRAMLDVNFRGALSMVRAFAPVLAANGGGPIVNIASSASWYAFPGLGAYAAAKAANWNMSNALRHELAGQGTLVTSVHIGAGPAGVREVVPGVSERLGPTGREPAVPAGPGQLRSDPARWARFLERAVPTPRRCRS